MKKSTKNLYIIGLCLFLFGELLNLFIIIREALFFLPNIFNEELNAEYVTKSFLLYIGSIIVNLIISFLIIFMTTRIFKNTNSKCLIPLLCFSTLFLIINLATSLPAIPQYLIYSKIAVIDTLWPSLIQYITSGIIFGVTSNIILIIASIQVLRQRMCDKNNG